MVVSQKAWSFDSENLGVDLSIATSQGISEVKWVIIDNILKAMTVLDTDLSPYLTINNILQGKLKHKDLK